MTISSIIISFYKTRILLYMAAILILSAIFVDLDPDRKVEK